MKKHGFIVLLLAVFLISMQVVAVDLESANSFIQEISEITIMNIKEEVAITDCGIIGKCETACLLAVPPSFMEAEPAQAGALVNNNYSDKIDIAMFSYIILESDDPKGYITKMKKRRFEHPAFIGIA